MLLGGLFCLAAAVAQPVSDSLQARYRQMALAYNDDLKAAQKNIEAGIELERAARVIRLPSREAVCVFCSSSGWSRWRSSGCCSPIG